MFIPKETESRYDSGLSPAGPSGDASVSSLGPWSDCSSVAYY